MVREGLHIRILFIRPPCDIGDGAGDHFDGLTALTACLRKCTGELCDLRCTLLCTAYDRTQFPDEGIEVEDDPSDFIIALCVKLLRQIPLALRNAAKRIRQRRQRTQNLCENQPECTAHHKNSKQNHAELDVLGPLDLRLSGGIVGSDQLVDLCHKGRNLFCCLCLCGAARLLIRSLGSGTDISAVRLPQRLHNAELSLDRLIRGCRQPHRRIALLQPLQNTIVVLQILLHRRAQRLCVALICRHEPCCPPRKLIGAHPQRAGSVDRGRIPLEFIERKEVQPN